MIYCGLEIFEIDGCHRFFNVQFARHPVQSGTVPIEDPVGRVAVLLNLDDHIAFADGMQPPAGNKNAVAPFDRDDVESFFNTVLREAAFRTVAG